MGSVFKLLMTTDNSEEITNYTNTLCETLSKNMDVDIKMVNVNSKKENKEPEFDTNYLDKNLNWNDDIEQYKQNCSFCENQIKDIIDEFNPHLIHFNHYLCLKKQDKACVLAAHDDVLNKIRWTKRRGRNYPVDYQYKQYKDFLKNNFNNTDIIITKSKFIAESIGKTYNFNNRIKVIYNAINEESWNEKPASVSLLTTIKNNYHDCNLLTKTAYRLPNNINIYALGNKPANLQTPPNINFISNIDAMDKTNLYRRSSIYLALSNWDTFYTGLIKAAYSNCAIIANDVPLFKELWGDCANIFERNDLNSLIKNINNLVENNALLDKNARQCQTKAISTFNSKRMCYQYINLYKNLLKERFVNG